MMRSMRTARSAIVVGFLSFIGCASSQGHRPEPTVDRARIDAVLDALHAAAARADESAYFSKFTPDAVFLGTDPAERWSLDAFRAYAAPHFASGRGWTYIPSARNVMLAPDGTVAWFDEVVTNEKYGRCRGTGVVVRRPDGWRVAQYSLSLPIPNSMFTTVADAIKAASNDATPERD